MFTGIIEKTGKVLALVQGEKSAHLTLETHWDDLALGESVAVNGTCLTVESEEGSNTGLARFDLSGETLQRTQLGELDVGSLVNLERSLRADTRLSGHWVQGHVDGIGRFLKATPEGEGFTLDFEIPSTLRRYCVEKGSIAIQGISLTIGSLEDQSSGSARIRVHVIPVTWKLTNLSSLSSNDAVNIEVDVLAKYVERFMNQGLDPRPSH